MIFDVKLDGFQKLDGFHWKARLVAGGHQTEPPANVLTNVSVVSGRRFTLLLLLLHLMTCR